MREMLLTRLQVKSFYLHKSQQTIKKNRSQPSCYQHGQHETEGLMSAQIQFNTVPLRPEVHSQHLHTENCTQKREQDQKINPRDKHQHIHTEDGYYLHRNLMFD